MKINKKTKSIQQEKRQNAKSAQGGNLASNQFSTEFGCEMDGQNNNNQNNRNNQ